MHPAFRVLASAACVGGLAVLPLYRGFSRDLTLSWRDTALLHAPVRTLVAGSLRTFRLPLWNPYEGTGQPLLGQSLHGVLHPITVATAWLGGGIDAWLIGLVAFAAVGAFVAARALGVSLAGCSGAALAYALSGYVLGMTGNGLYLAGAASAPWVVAGLRTAAVRGGPFIVAAAAAVACAAFAGDPQSLATSALAGLALGGAVAGVRGVARGSAGILLGCALGAVQLLPSWFFLRTTSRAAGALPASDLVQWPLDPIRLVELLAPGFFVGRPSAWQAPVFMALGSPSAYPFPWSPSVFVGAAVFLLAAVAATRSREGRILALLSALFAWLALGHHLGAQQLLSGVPLWGGFRYSEKLVGPMTLCLALAAGIGIDAARRTRRVAGPALGVAAAFSLLSLACAAGWPAVGRVLAALGAHGEAAEAARAHLAVGGLHAAAGSAALAGLAWLGPRLEYALGPALAALVFAQSAAATPFAIHVGNAESARACPPPLDAAPPGPRILTALVHNVRSGAGGLDAIDTAVARWGRVGLASLNVGCRVEGIEGYTGIASLRATAVLAEPRRRLALGARYGATHVVSEAPEDPDDAAVLRQATARGRLVRLDAASGTAVWEIPHREWASFATRARVAPELGGAAGALMEEVSAGRETVVLEAPSPPPCARGRVLRVERHAERLEIEAESVGEGLLVVNDAFAPGWRATIDGIEAPVLPADVLVRAVRWPAGRHRLVMRYAPPEVAVGAAISIAAAVALAAWLAADARAGRRRPDARTG